MHVYTSVTRCAHWLFGFDFMTFIGVCQEFCSQGGGGTWAGSPPSEDQVHPPDQVHPFRTRYTPPWTRYTRQDQVPSPGTRYPPPRDQVHPSPPRTRYPPHSSACWEIRATSGRYASYWNAFLFIVCRTKCRLETGIEPSCNPKINRKPPIMLKLQTLTVLILFAEN